MELGQLIGILWWSMKSGFGAGVDELDDEDEFTEISPDDATVGNESWWLASA